MCEDQLPQYAGEDKFAAVQYCTELSSPFDLNKNRIWRVGVCRLNSTSWEVYAVRDKVVEKLLERFFVLVDTLTPASATPSVGVADDEESSDDGEFDAWGSFSGGSSWRARPITPSAKFTLRKRLYAAAAVSRRKLRTKTTQCHYDVFAQLAASHRVPADTSAVLSRLLFGQCCEQGDVALVNARLLGTLRHSFSLQYCRVGKVSDRETTQFLLRMRVELMQLCVRYTNLKQLVNWYYAVKHAAQLALSLDERADFGAEKLDESSNRYMRILHSEDASSPGLTYGSHLLENKVFIGVFNDVVARHKKKDAEKVVDELSQYLKAFGDEEVVPVPQNTAVQRRSVHSDSASVDSDGDAESDTETVVHSMKSVSSDSWTHKNTRSVNIFRNSRISTNFTQIFKETPPATDTNTAQALRRVERNVLYEAVFNYLSLKVLNSSDKWQNCFAVFSVSNIVASDKLQRIPGSSGKNMNVRVYKQKEWAQMTENEVTLESLKKTKTHQKVFKKSHGESVHLQTINELYTTNREKYVRDFAGSFVYIDSFKVHKFMRACKTHAMRFLFQDDGAGCVRVLLLGGGMVLAI